MKDNSLKNFKDTMASQIFGMTVEEAHKEGVCVDCRQPWGDNTYSPSGEKEYRISGLCEKCFDKITGDE